jgi:hypothetical protein
VEKYWFWIEYDSVGVTAELHYAEDPTTDGWDSFPAPDAEHFVIGYADSFNGADDKQLIIRQYQRTDIGSGSGGGGSFPVWL